LSVVHLRAVYGEQHIAGLNTGKSSRKTARHSNDPDRRGWRI
jgi:hypothetical protein